MEGSAVITSFTRERAEVADRMNVINSLREKEKKICVRPGDPPNSKKVVPYVRKRRSTKPSATYFGVMIEDYMAINNMLQRDFAEKIGVKEDAVSRWRAGKHFPKERTINRICKATGIPKERIRDEIKKGML